MLLEKLYLQNFRCYKELSIDFDKQLTVIVGENGRGKTAIFDAIAVALEPYLSAFGMPGRSVDVKDVRRSPVYAENGKHIESMVNCFPLKIELSGTSDGVEEALSGSVTIADKAGQVVVGGNIHSLGQMAVELIKEGTDKQIELPVLAYYGTSRIWVDSHLLKEQDKSFADRGVGYLECMEPSSSYNTFGQWYGHMSKCGDSVSKTVCKAVSQAIDTCLESTGLGHISYNNDLDCLVIEHPELGELIVADLSDGARSMISLAADLAYRMVRLNPQLGERAVLDSPGVVLIDEIDMHLHPLWQQTILHDLQAAFPKVQFIITTHSPQVLSSVPADTIRIVYWNNGEQGIRRVDFSLGADSGQLLKDIQNVSARPPSLPVVKDLQRYLHLVSEDKWDSQEAKELRKRLDAWSKGNEPALIRADMDIRLRQFRRHKS